MGVEKGDSGEAGRGGVIPGDNAEVVMPMMRQERHKAARKEGLVSRVTPVVHEVRFGISKQTSQEDTQAVTSSGV